MLTSCFRRRRPVRRACALWFLPLAALAWNGCNREAGSPSEGRGRVESTVRMGDPRMAPQLGKGFYGIEGGAWRWTNRQFSLTLLPPAGSAQTGAVLQFDLTVPGSVIQSIGNITLFASIGDRKFPAVTYSKPGSYKYKADVPASLLAGETVQVDFELDKTMPAAPPERRDLGVVAGAIGLTAKAAQ